MKCYLESNISNLHSLKKKKNIMFQGKKRTQILNNNMKIQLVSLGIQQITINFLSFLN
jgi:hypothetical protein